MNVFFRTKPVNDEIPVCNGQSVQVNEREEMGVCTDDTILLSRESTEKLLTTLITDGESLSLRDKFIADVQNSIALRGDGSIIMDIPEITTPPDHAVG